VAPWSLRVFVPKLTAIQPCWWIWIAHAMVLQQVLPILVANNGPGGGPRVLRRGDRAHASGWHARGVALEAWPLHERALARGAPLHWLGHLAVDDVEAVYDRLVRLGSEALGPTVRGSDGTPFATLRDPFGDVIAIRARGGRPNDSPVVYLPVAVIDAAIAQVRALGGTAMEPFVLPDGMRLAACEDPQGATFGLAQTS
jgi:predicted enzyme related to lactoylglutathione lyase